jgi:hypothetical protein
MAVGSFSQLEAYGVINGMTHGKFSQVVDRQVTLNRAVRVVNGDVDLRSHKRRSQLSPNLFRDVFQYSAPSDLKLNKIVDIRKQVNRSSAEGWILVDESDFDRYKNASSNHIALGEDELVRTLLIDGVEGDTKAVLHNCDSVTANGTWAVGADASNITADTDNFITGSGSLNFDTAAGAATAYIELTGATQVDLTDHADKGSVFIWVYIPDATDASADAVTNFILRIGNDSSNYVSRTVTTTNEGATFYDGWNLLRFDLNGATASAGTVTWSEIDYLRLTITKPAGFDADTDWRVDDIVSRVGDIYDVVYYSRYGWQSSAGAYLEDSTASTDLLNADTNELELIASKCGEFASQELKDWDDVKYFQNEYKDVKMNYEAQSPSEALRIRRVYYDAPTSGRGRGWGRTAS